MTRKKQPGGFNDNSKARINMVVNRSKLDEIKKLMEIAGVSTQKELFDNALTLVKWSMRQKMQGKEIGALDRENKFKELEMPILEHAKEYQEDF